MNMSFLSTNLGDEFPKKLPDWQRHTGEQRINGSICLCQEREHQPGCQGNKQRCHAQLDRSGMFP